jgi:hypothetical protein
VSAQLGRTLDADRHVAVDGIETREPGHERAAFAPASDSLMMPTIWVSVNWDLRIWATPRGQLPRGFALIAGILSWAQVSRSQA